MARVVCTGQVSVVSVYLVVGERGVFENINLDDGIVRFGSNRLNRICLYSLVPLCCLTDACIYEFCFYCFASWDLEPEMAICIKSEALMQGMYPLSGLWMVCARLT